MIPDTDKNNIPNIIPLGTCCRLINTLVSLDLKQDSHLFDWMRSYDFKDILKIISKVINNENIEINEYKIYKGNLCLDDTNIFTSHYNKEKFIECIKKANKNNPILFIREELHDEITKDDIITFKNLINKINTNCVFKFLLVSPEVVHNIIIDDLLHVKHTPDTQIYKSYINDIMSLYDI